MASTFKPFFNPLLHILGWTLLVFLLLFYVPLSWNIEVPAIFWIWQIIVLLMMLAVFYINAKIIVPNSIIKDKIGIFILWLIGIVLLTQLIANLYAAYTHIHTKMERLLGEKRKENEILDVFIFIITSLVLAISTSWSMSVHWQMATQQIKELEQDKTAAELAMLKTQINPHFFFNSLNSIYSLTYIDQEDSRKALLTLSRMMRYLLYSAENGITTLANEVDFLKDYISLMRLRASEKVSITTDIQVVRNDYPIGPMLLLPFVENAFKHGIDPIAETEIKIALKQEGSLLKFDVMNYVFPKAESSKEEGGVGLVNTRRRLQLLYPQQYQLDTGITPEGKYKVHLQINLVS